MRRCDGVLTLTTFVVSLVLVACQNGESQRIPASETSVSSPTTANVPTNTPTETASFGNTVSPTQVFPTSTPTPFEDFPLHELDLDRDFFFQITSPDCQLPCWEGIEPGVSKYEEAEQILNDVFSLDDLQLLPSAALPYSISGTTTLRLNWRNADQGGGLTLHVVINDETNTVEVLSFRWSPELYFDNFSVARILNEVGAPDELYSAIRSTGSPDSRLIDIYMVYRQGIVIHFSYGLALEDGKSLFCLGSEDYAGVLVYLISPYTVVNDLSLSQQAVLPNPDDPELISGEELFGMTTQELISSLEDNESDCLHIDLGT